MDVDSLRQKRSRAKPVAVAFVHRQRPRGVHLFFRPLASRSAPFGRLDALGSVEKGPPDSAPRSGRSPDWQRAPIRRARRSVPRNGKDRPGRDAFQRALQKEPANMPALWGAAQVAMARQNFAAAKPHLEQILANDRSYKFGDVSLAQCRTLAMLKETDAACECLEQHLKRWTHPEAYVLLATLLIERGDVAAAREHLEATLSDLSGGPAFFARQNRSWARKAKRLLARLPRL